MRQVERAELLDWATYSERREALRAAAMQAKALRRVEVGRSFTFLFENRDTIRYQIQEMMRAEQIVREADIEHELATYNELLGGPGELGCTLLIELPDERERAARLREWIGLLPHVYAVRSDGSRVPPRWDARQVGTDRLSAVQYLKFEVGPAAPRAVGVSFPGVTAETALGEDQRRALQADLDELGAPKV